MTKKRKRTIVPKHRRQTSSPSYRLPALDTDYLMSDSMRGVRFMLEYSKAEEALRGMGIQSTLVVFGSARVSPGNIWYDEARKFGRLASQRGGALDGSKKIRDNVIATGGGPGVMEAANRGASETGAPTIGFNIKLPQEQVPNHYSTPELTFQFHYFAMRKMHLAMRAVGLVVFPGGFGTLDELFEILTLRQTGKVSRLPVVLFDRDYWSRLINFEVMIENNMIDPADLKLFSFADDAEQIWSRLLAGGLTVPADSGRSPR